MLSSMVGGLKAAGEHRASSTSSSGVSSAEQESTQSQSGSPQPNQRLGVLTVRVPVQVKNGGEAVTDLSVNNFQVFEDRTRQVIDEFESRSASAFRIGILMDTSESARPKMAFEKRAAEGFVTHVTRHLVSRWRQDRLLFATFDSSLELQQDFTDSGDTLTGAIKNAKAGDCCPRLYDAVSRVIEEKMAGREAASMRILVLLSDGRDAGSERSLREAIEIAQRYRVSVFGITTDRVTRTAKVLSQSDRTAMMSLLCRETGGELLFAPNEAGLSRAFDRISSELGHEYIIFYTPRNQQKTGERRSIAVNLVGANGSPYYKQGYTY